MAPQFEFVVQGHYGRRWEDVCAEPTRLEGLARLREYRDNESAHPHRMITRRVKRAAFECPSGFGCVTAEECVHWDYND